MMVCGDTDESVTVTDAEPLKFPGRDRGMSPTPHHTLLHCCVIQVYLVTCSFEANYGSAITIILQLAPGQTSVGHCPSIILTLVLGCCLCAIAATHRSTVILVASSLSSSLSLSWFSPLSLPLSTCQIALIVPTTSFPPLPFTLSTSSFPLLFSFSLPFHLR